MGDGRVPSPRHRRAKIVVPKRRLIAAAVPAALAVSVPAALAVWPDAESDPAASDQPVSLEDFTRNAPAARGDERTPEPEGTTPESRGPEATVAPEEPEETPEETEEAEEAGDELTVDAEMYTTARLNVRTAPDSDSDVVTVLDYGATVQVTTANDGAWVQVVYDGSAAWVNGDYLSAEEPPEPASEDQADEGGGDDQADGGGDESGDGGDDTGLSMDECPTGSAVESGLVPDAIRVHRAVCAQFPQIETYGGLRSGGGAHSEGRALDIMVTGSLGDQIAAWVREHHEELGVSEVIWAQRIWTVQRSSEGWRWMEDGGSDTDNHYDHVHVTVYGDSGTL